MREVGHIRSERANGFTVKQLERTEKKRRQVIILKSRHENKVRWSGLNQMTLE